MRDFLSSRVQLSNKRELMQIDLGQASEEEHSDLADELDEQSDENDSDSDAAPVSKAPAAAPARRSTRRGRPTAPMLEVPEEYVRLCAQEDEDDKWFGDD